MKSVQRFNSLPWGLSANDSGRLSSSSWILFLLFVTSFFKVGNLKVSEVLSHKYEAFDTFRWSFPWESHWGNGLSSLSRVSFCPLPDTMVGWREAGVHSHWFQQMFALFLNLLVQAIELQSNHVEDDGIHSWESWAKVHAPLLQVCRGL